eukprot:3429259-Amphidinium_carterae.1
MSKESTRRVVSELTRFLYDDAAREGMCTQLAGVLTASHLGAMRTYQLPYYTLAQGVPAAQCFAVPPNRDFRANASHVVNQPVDDAISPLGETTLLYCEEVCGLTLPMRYACHVGSFDAWLAGVNVPGYANESLLLSNAVSPWCVDTHMSVWGFSQYPGSHITADGITGSFGSNLRLAEPANKQNFSSELGNPPPRAAARLLCFLMSNAEATNIIANGVRMHEFGARPGSSSASGNEMVETSSDIVAVPDRM